MKINIDGTEYRKIEGAMTWEVRSGPVWAYVQPIMATLLDALAVERDACDKYKFKCPCSNSWFDECITCAAHTARRAAEAKKSDLCPRCGDAGKDYDGYCRPCLRAIDAAEATESS